MDGPHFDGFADVVEIGHGGFGVVYRAIDVVLNRPVAIKVLATILAGSELERFQREGLAMSALSGHPNVVPVYSSGVTAEGRPYLVMQYLGRGSLRTRVASGARPWAEVARVGVRVSGALETAHRLGILHRDIKPDNILVSDFDEPMLADFGIARLAGAFETISRRVTASVVYAAPEVLDGQTATVAADIYSLGATLYHLLAGGPAFAPADDQALVALYLRISREPVPDLGAFGVPAAIGAVISRAMAKQPHDRHASAEQFGRELQDAERDAGVAVTPIAIGGPVGVNRPAAVLPATSTISAPGTDATGHRSHRRGRRRGAVIVSGAALVAVAAVVAWLIIRSSTAPTTSDSPGPIATIVDATPASGPLTLSDTPTDISMHIPAHGAADIRIAATAGDRLLGSVTLATAPRRPVPIAVLFNNSPAESNDITDVNVDIGPVVLQSSGTWVVQIGPATDAIDGRVELGLAPPDVQVTVPVGGAVEVGLPRSRQRAFIRFDARSGQRVVARWTWKGADPLSTHLDLVAPDGTTVLTSWDAVASGQSKPTTLPVDGTYTIDAAIDGDGTGAATVAVAVAVG